MDDNVRFEDYRALITLTSLCDDIGYGFEHRYNVGTHYVCIHDNTPSRHSYIGMAPKLHEAALNALYHMLDHLLEAEAKYEPAKVDC